MAEEQKQQMSLEDAYNNSLNNLASGFGTNEDINIVKAYNNSIKSNDYTVTTSGGTTSGRNSSTSESNSNTNATSSSVSGTRINGIRYNKDGTPDPNDVAAYRAKGHAQLDSANKAFTDAIGVNRDKLRADRLKEQLTNARRAKIAAWSDSAKVIADMITAGAGGNVYKRDPNGIVEKAHESNMKLKELQNAEDAAYQQQLAKANLDNSLKHLELDKSYDDMFSQKITSSSSDSTTNSTGSSSGNTYSTTPQTTSTHSQVKDSTWKGDPSKKKDGKVKSGKDAV